MWNLESENHFKNNSIEKESYIIYLPNKIKHTKVISNLEKKLNYTIKNKRYIID